MILDQYLQEKIGSIALQLVRLQVSLATAFRETIVVEIPNGKPLTLMTLPRCATPSLASSLLLPL